MVLFYLLNFVEITEYYFSHMLCSNAWNCDFCEYSLFSQEPSRSAVVDSSIRITDNGRDILHRNVQHIPDSFCSLDSFIPSI